jgi:hypothetical protein
VAITYKSALDDPGRIKKSRNAGALFGLTPKRYQSGETDITGGISRVGADTRRGHEPAADFVFTDNPEHGLVQFLQLLEQRGSRGQHGLGDLLKHRMTSNELH